MPVPVNVYTIGDLMKLVEECDPDKPITISVVHDDTEFDIWETWTHKGGLYISIKPKKAKVTT